MLGRGGYSTGSMMIGMRRGRGESLMIRGITGAREVDTSTRGMSMGMKGDAPDVECRLSRRGAGWNETGPRAFLLLSEFLDFGYLRASSLGCLLVVC